MSKPQKDARLPVRKRDMYPAVAADAARRRIREAQVVTSADIGEPEYRVLTPDEVADVNVDESYQRRRVDRIVEEIAEVIRRGGVVADPVSIAVRPDKSMWVVDGQQRWWAHLSEVAPMPSMLYHVSDLEAEKRLFDILNHRVNLSGATTIRAWAGPAKDLLDWLDNDPTSALRGKIGWAGGRSQVIFKVEVLLSGIGSLLTNTVHTGAVRDRLLRLDTEIRRRKTWSSVATALFARLLNDVFPPGQATHLRQPIAVAFGRTAHLRWSGLYERDSARWPYPTQSQIAKLQTVDWYQRVPRGGPDGVSAAIAIIEDAWNLQRVR